MSGTSGWRRFDGFNASRSCRLTAEAGSYSVRSQLRLRWQVVSTGYRVQDLWLASQAIQHGFGLLIRNRRDFEDIPGLDLVLYELVERS